METTDRERPRAITARVMAALVGGYGVTALAQIALSAPLARVITRSDAVWLATMLILPVFPGGVIYAFAARSAPRAWLGLGTAMTVLALVRWAL
jgi:hypothetical protein